jgi:hypothetical protein
LNFLQEILADLEFFKLNLKKIQQFRKKFSIICNLLIQLLPIFIAFRAPPYNPPSNILGKAANNRNRRNWCEKRENCGNRDQSDCFPKAATEILDGAKQQKLSSTAHDLHRHFCHSKSHLAHDFSRIFFTESRRFLKSLVPETVSTMVWDLYQMAKQ